MAVLSPADAPLAPRRPTSRGSRVALLALVTTWAVVGFFGLRPRSLVADWNGWRQADTQTIALNLAKPEGRLLYPQIAWGGDGTGYVEAELQLYTGLVAPVLRLVGPHEWPGQLVSLMLFAGSGMALGFLLLERFGLHAALLGAFSFLSTRAALHLSTSVQPESLVVLLFVLAFGAFLRFEATSGSRFLILFALTGALAMMVKPSAAQIGVATFALVAFRSRHLLKSPRLWIAWLGMVSCLVAYLLFAREIFLVHGNTFGVLSGGDSKLPRLEHLLRPGLYVEAARVAVLWGLGPVAALVALVLGIRGRLAAEALALVPGAAAWTVLTLRYSSEETFGSHYSVLAGVIGGWCVAQAVRSLQGSRWRHWGLGALALALVIQYATSASVRRRHHEPDRGASCVIALAEATRGAVVPGDLIVVRAGTFAYDRYWKTPNNYQDPRPFYLAGARGWVLGSDEDDATVLDRLRGRGARVYLEPDARFRTPAIDRWLESEARPIATTDCGRAFALPPRPTSSLEPTSP
jgi:hypothetical protein